MILGVFDFLIYLLLRFAALDRSGSRELARLENLGAELVLLL